jgi:hypothetical protein
MPHPAWCIVDIGDLDAAADVGPYHGSDYETVHLGRSDADEDLLVCLEQEFHSPEPYIRLLHKDRYDLELTVDEALQLAGTLIALVREAARRAASGV